jgi:hypothetical protein
MRTASRKVAAALAACLTFASVSHAQVSKPIVIDDDDGGNVDNFLLWYGRLRASGTPVILRGICISACTFVLALPKSQVCVEPTASFGFHMAAINGKAVPGMTGALIRRWYPEPVRRWLADKDLQEEPIYMSASEAVKLGVFPACGATQ